MFLAFYKKDLDLSIRIHKKEFPVRGLFKILKSCMQNLSIAYCNHNMSLVSYNKYASAELV